MTKKIKVMHFVSGLVSGGVEEMLYNYCNHMKKDDYEFIIVYQHKPVEVCKEKLESIGCRTIRITARSESFYRNIKESVSIINKEKPDIVHAHMNLMNFCALYAAKKNHVKVRISHSHIAEKNKSFIFNIMANVCKKLNVHYATSLFTCGQEAGYYMYGNRKMDSHEVVLVENAIDLKKFQVDDDERLLVKKQYGVENKFVVGHVGRFSKQKNHKRLLEIFTEVLKRVPEAVLLLVGAGELEEETRKYAKMLKIDDKVIFFGTTPKMSEVYAMMDIFVLPSLFEGFPVVSIEIQAADIPAVFSATIASTCKITSAIDFFDLNSSDSEWADTIIDKCKKYRKTDLKDLYDKYDIVSNAQKLDVIYKQLKEYYE